MYIAGIDGGGTKTRLERWDLSGKPLDRKEFGPFNINSIGRDAFAERLREVFAACAPMSDCASLCIGAAGISRTETAATLHDILNESDFKGKLRLCGDHEIALRGAVKGPGIILVAGTGSIAYGVDENGHSERVGGYGHLIDDCGSGYAIGRDALSLTVQTLDGRKETNDLSRAILERIGAKDGSGVVDYTYASETGKSGIAALAMTVLGSAQKGDPAAIGILEREAAALGDMVTVLKRKLQLSAPRIVLFGSLLTNDSVYRDLVREKLSQLGTITPPEHDALYGAAALAWENAAAQASDHPKADKNRL